MKKLKKEHFLLFALFLAIVPYCYLSFFAQPMAEDFGFAHYYQKDTFFELIKNSYLKMNGRYIANSLMYLNPISFGNFLGYKLIPFFLILLFAIGVFFLMNQVFHFLSKKNKTILSLILSLAFLQNMPIISEGLYWYTAAIIYMGGIIVSIFYITLFIWHLRNKNSLLGKIALTFLLFILCGFNEVLTLLTLFFFRLNSVNFLPK